MKIFSLLKRVPKVKILIPLILIAGFSEAVGLAILIPIVSTLTNESQNNSLPGIFKYFEEILQIFPTDKQFIVLLGFALFFMILSYFLIYIHEKTVFKSRFRLLKDLRNNLTKSIVRLIEKDCLRNLFAERNWKIIQEKGNQEYWKM